MWVRLDGVNELETLEDRNRRFTDACFERELSWETRTKIHDEWRRSRLEPEVGLAVFPAAPVRGMGAQAQGVQLRRRKSADLRETFSRRQSLLRTTQVASE